MIVIYTAVQNIFYDTHIMYYQFWARYRKPNIIIVPTDRDRTYSDRGLFVLNEKLGVHTVAVLLYKISPQH